MLDWTCCATTLATARKAYQERTANRKPSLTILPAISIALSSLRVPTNALPSLPSYILVILTWSLCAPCRMDICQRPFIDTQRHFKAENTLLVDGLSEVGYLSYLSELYHRLSQLRMT